MKISKFKVENRQIRIVEYDTVLAGHHNVDTFKSEFDEEWNELDKTLVLITPDKTRYHVALLNDGAVLPKEVYVDNRSILMGIFGKKGETTLSTSLISLWMTKGAYGEGQEPDNLPTSTQWDLYIAEINELLKSCQLSEEACEKALADLIELKDEALLKMEALKEETQNFRDETSNLKDETQVIADGVKDMASAIQLPMWYVDENLKLHQVTATKLTNLSFRLENGKFIERVVK